MRRTAHFIIIESNINGLRPVMVEEDHTQNGVKSLQIPPHVIDRVTKFIMTRLTRPDVSKVTAAKVKHAVRSLSMETYLTYVNVITEQIQLQCPNALPVAHSTRATS